MGFTMVVPESRSTRIGVHSRVPLFWEVTIVLSLGKGSALGMFSTCGFNDQILGLRV